VRFGRVLEVRDRVARERVRAALQQDQLRTRGVDVALDFLPGCEERLVAGAGRHRHVELRALGRAAASLRAAARAGIKETAVLVQVGKRDVGVALERVEHAVAVMRVDVDVRDAAQPEDLPRGFDRDAAIVEHAETRGRVARCMVQSADRNECAARGPLDYRR
jgi:hypothetical protein